MDSPSDVEAGTFVGYQVPQELSVLSHSLLHIHFLLLRHTHLCHDEPPRRYRRQTQTRRHSAERGTQALQGSSDTVNSELENVSFFILFPEQEFANFFFFYTWRHLKGHTHETDIMEFVAMNADGCVVVFILPQTNSTVASCVVLWFLVCRC